MAEPPDRTEARLRAAAREHGPGRPATVATRLELGYLLLDRGRPAEAAAELADLPELLDDVGLAFAVRCDVALLELDRTGSTRALGRVYEAAGEELGRRHPVTLRARAVCSLAMGDGEAVRQVLAEDGSLADVRLRYARLLHELGRRVPAERECLRLIDTLPDDAPDALRARALLAASAHDHGQLAAVVRAQVVLRGPDHPEVAESRLLLGLVLLGLDLPGEHELRAALDIRTRRLGPTHAATLEIARFLPDG
ncbi:hypothetical protein GCM10022243_02360 [Saccharothrix violaceirubra]|uniref:Thioredoxin-like negative regulator of GroEL n=1 Tax=Saccharothrix violaceirubra TaxID=413306 RepID=A0A7W7T3R2_9PSEU|nr:tetratricopeptide repeat protein [Saccharothrix violaceirubra]MBB4965993.1 thioredoxin-like negative regulator of GroEL [Saccharothrix violaceirubra]